MILLVTNKRDITTDYIVRELRKRKIKYYRLNTESLATYECSIGYETTDDWRIGSIKGSHVQSAYFRRPSPPEYTKSTEVSENEYLASEWMAFLKSIYARLEGKWFNSPISIALAEDKPKQLLLAKEAGFSVPNGLITNVTNDIVQNVGQSGLIIKPVRQGLIEGKQEKVIFTSRIPKVTTKHTSAISHVPSIFQQEIIKKFDVRVTVVGKQIFPVAIYSQDVEQTRVDWRKGGKIDLRHQIITLPTSLAESCMELTSKLNLKFGAIDLVCDQEDNYWFLEINPNGQWAWIENQTKLPIASAIVDELVACGSNYEL
jgi:glutathione synthase/RimK-type ligase-like ATP-grasp enzyme